MQSKTLVAAPIAGLAISIAARSTRLTFKGLPNGTLGSTANADYGDRVIEAGNGVTLDGGATPNIVLDFVPRSAGQTQFEVYRTGYSGLGSALGDT